PHERRSCRRSSALTRTHALASAADAVVPEAVVEVPQADAEGHGRPGPVSARPHQGVHDVQALELRQREAARQGAGGCGGRSEPEPWEMLQIDPLLFREDDRALDPVLELS